MVALSGILAHQASAVIEAYSAFFEDVRVAGEEGEWVIVTADGKKSC